MKKEDVVNQLLKNVKEAVPEFDLEKASADMSYKDMGVSSLDLVDIVNKTMREMDLKISPTDLGKVGTISELADLFVASKKS